MKGLALALRRVTGIVNKGLKLILLGSIYSYSLCSLAAKIPQTDPATQFQQDWAQEFAQKYSSPSQSIQANSNQRTYSQNLTKTRYQNFKSFDRQIRTLHEYLTSLATKKQYTFQQVEHLIKLYEDVYAAHLMHLEHFQIKQQKIEKAGVGGEFLQRLTAEQQVYQQNLQALIGHFEPLHSAYSDTTVQTDLVAESAFQSRLNLAIVNSKQVLDALAPSQPVRILRNSLPYRSAVLARRIPQSSVSIVPSYESNVLPTSDDLRSSAEAPLSETILKKAEELEHDYIKIYEFVHNEITTEWYVGSRKGAEGTLLQMSGNDIDQASLLIALFRASGLAARYVHGTIEISLESIQNSLGLTTPEQAIQAMNAAGVAYSPIIRGGKIAALQIEYTWVSAFVPYSNYRGTVLDRSGEQWLPLMPAFKTNEVTPSTGLIRKAGINVDTLIHGYLASRQLTSLHQQLDESINYYLAGDPQQAPYDTQLGAVLVKPVEMGLIPSTLPVTVVDVAHEAYELAEQYQQKIRFIARRGVNDSDTIIIDRTIALSEIANRRLTLSYLPATIDDHTLTNSFGGLDLVPSYLIRLRPEIKLEGRKLFTAEGIIETGIAHRLDVEIITSAGTEVLKHTIISGSYHAMNLATGEASFAQKTNDAADTEFLGAKILSQVGQEYNKRWTEAENEFSQLLNVAVVRPFPSFNLVSNDMRVETVLGQPQQLQWKGVTLDAGFRVSQAIDRSTPDESNIYNNVKDFTRLTALQGSSLEHLIFEDLFKVASVSADKGIQEARSAGQTVLIIDGSNMASQLPLLTHPAEVIEDIQAWVVKGYQVTVPQSQITINDWQGSVWQVVDLNTGSGGYFIAGGLAGGATSLGGQLWVLDWLQAALEAAYSPEPNSNPNSGYSISKYNDPGYIKGIVGKKLQTAIMVQVKDEKGRPVAGAEVKFSASEGTLLDNNSWITDYSGLARVGVTLGTSTEASSIYQKQNPGDEFSSRASQNYITAEVNSELGKVFLPDAFHVIAFPDVAAEIVALNQPDTSGVTYNEGSLPRVRIADSWADSISIKALDQYGNIVSNASVSAAMTAEYTACTRYGQDGIAPLTSVSPGLLIAQEQEGSNISFRTTPFPTIISVRMGVYASTVYPVKIEGAGSSLEYRFEVATQCGDSWTIGAGGTTFYTIDGINSVAAAKPGEKIKAKFSGQYVFTGSEGHPEIPIVSVLPGKAEFIVDNGGSASSAFEDGEFYSTEVTVGSTPGVHGLRMNLTVEGDHLVNFIQDGTFLETAIFKPVYSVLPAVGALVSKDSTGYIDLGTGNRSLLESTYQYNILPASYVSASVDLDLLEDGAIFASYIGSSLSSTGHVTLPAGIYFNPDRNYQAQVVLNRGSLFEIKSEPVDLPFARRLILFATDDSDLSQDLNLTNVSSLISASAEVDSVNNRVCVKDGIYKFEISEEAKVTLEIAGNKILDDVQFSGGTHSIPINAGSIGAGIHESVLTAIATSNGKSESYNGVVSVILKNSNSLPVGHTLVKGVNVSNGNLTLSRSDFGVPARGQPLEISRTYSSNNGAAMGPMGVGWSFNYNASLNITPCGVVELSGGTGGGNRFVETEDGSLEPLKGYHGTLIGNEADNSFDFYAKDGTRYHYKNYGRANWDLEYIEDTNKNRTKFTYEFGANYLQKLVSIEGPGGRIINFDHELRSFLRGGGLLPKYYYVITKITLGEISVEYDYDEFGNLISVSRNDSARTENYTYGIDKEISRHKLITYTDPNANVTSYSYVDHNIYFKLDEASGITIPYSSINTVTEPEGIVSSFSYDFENRATTFLDPRGNSSEYSYNQYGSVTKLARPIGTTITNWVEDDVLIDSVVDPNGNVTQYSYDEHGNILTTTRPDESVIINVYHPVSEFAIGEGKAVKNRIASITDPNGNVTEFNYDSAGNLERISNPDGGVIKHSYNASGDRKSSTDAKGNLTRFTHDVYGNITKVTDALGNSTETQRDGLGLPIVIIDANGNSTSNTFDALQRLVQSVDALDGVTVFTYDANNNKLSEKDPNGNTTSWSYDGINRVTQITNAMGKTQAIGYDENSNKISETDYNGNTSSYAYDANDRLVSLVQPEGRVTSFLYDLSGNKLSETIGSQSTSYQYDELNRVITKTEPMGAVTSFEYDPVGNITKQTDPLQRESQFEYDSMNRVTKLAEPLGKTTTYTYDLNGNRLAETDANGVTRKFKYDAVNRLTEKTDGEGKTATNNYDNVGNITAFIDRRQNVTKYEYDALNRRNKGIDPTDAETSYEYDGVGNLLATKLPNGNNVSTSYDKLNRAIINIDSLGALFTRSYDGNGNLLTETNPKGEVTSNTYDGLNRLVEQVLPANRALSFTYDIYNNRKSFTDAGRNLTSYEYDDLNRMVKLTDPQSNSMNYTYDLVGNKLTETDKRGGLTSIVYDDLDRLIKVIDARGIESSFSYDLVGNKLTETNKKGILSKFTYDKENRLLSTVKDGLKLVTLEYDAVGNKAFESDANGNRVAYLYSKRNELIEQSEPLAAITVFTYDTMGNQLTVRDPESRTTSYAYDLRNRLLTETNAAQESTEYTYDGNGNRLSMKRPAGNTWNYQYDGADRLTAIIAPDSGSTAYSYDGNGNRLTQTDALGNTTSFAYDSLNRQISMSYPGSVAVSFEYDANGNRTGLTDANGKVFAYSYDALNRKTSASYPSSDTPSSNDIVSMVYAFDNNNNLVSVSETFSGGSNDRTTVKGYDNFDREVRVTNGDNKTLSYSYDANGNRKSVTDADGKVTSYHFDALNRVSSVINAQGVTSYQYDRSSRQTAVIYPNGTRANTEFDSAGRTKSITNLQNTSVISKFDYLLDSNGNRIQQTETQGASVEVTDYAYDSNDRLTETEISVAGLVNETTNYTYDSNYNRLSEVTIKGGLTTVDKTYVYNTRGQVTDVTDNLDATSSAVYSYDNNGNRIQKQSAQVTESYVYDVRDQLKEIKQGGSTIGQFLYDYQGLRVEKIAAGETKKYVYDDQSVLMQTDGDGSTLSKYDYGSNQLLSLNNVTEGAQFYLFDALGSPVNLTTTDGTVQARYQYDAFGNARSQTGDSANVFGFTGHEKDEETGLYYFKARYYDPTLGQFLTQDAFEGIADTPPSLHKYIYAYGNPTVYIDPDGNKAVVIGGVKMYEHIDENGGKSYSMQCSGDDCNQEANENFKERQDARAISDEVFEHFRQEYADINRQILEIAESLPKEQREEFLNRIARQRRDIERSHTENISIENEKGINVSLCSESLVASACAYRKRIATYVKYLEPALIAGDLLINRRVGVSGKSSKMLSKDKDLKAPEIKRDKSDFAGSCCGVGKCFAAGTLVQTKDGLKPIEEIDIGVLVTAKNEETGEIDWKPVTQLFVNDDDRVTYLLTLKDSNGQLESYEVTDNHPFMVQNVGWVDSISLEPGMEVSSQSENKLTVVSLEALNRSPITYNFEVADYHTYFVGYLGAWVHNQNGCICGNPTQSMRDRFRNNGVLDPITNRIRPLKPGEIMAVDHIFPKSRIREMPGYEFLTPDQQRKLLNDEYDLGNLQPLPGWLNSSKGDSVDWSKVKSRGLELHEDYKRDLKSKQQDLELIIQNKIFELLEK